MPFRFLFQVTRTHDPNSCITSCTLCASLVSHGNHGKTASLDRTVFMMSCHGDWCKVQEVRPSHLWSVRLFRLLSSGRSPLLSSWYHSPCSLRDRLLNLLRLLREDLLLLPDPPCCLFCSFRCSWSSCGLLGSRLCSSCFVGRFLVRITRGPSSRQRQTSREHCCMICKRLRTLSTASSRAGNEARSLVSGPTCAHRKWGCYQRLSREGHRPAP